MEKIRAHSYALEDLSSGSVALRLIHLVIPFLRIQSQVHELCIFAAVSHPQSVVEAFVALLCYYVEEKWFVVSAFCGGAIWTSEKHAYTTIHFPYSSSFQFRQKGLNTRIL